MIGSQEHLLGTNAFQGSLSWGGFLMGTGRA